ncbi:MAG: hypothetical protein M3133_07675 [Actinomycetota bacterium]|nr:hypothetical protein [Actinomycetota bacterium]
MPRRARQFAAAARARQSCQRPGCAGEGPYEAHHVIYGCDLRAAGRAVFHPHNALGLCSRCHADHHTGRRTLPIAALTDANLAYALAVLGDEARAYLAARYDGEDVRLWP